MVNVMLWSKSWLGVGYMLVFPTNSWKRTVVENVFVCCTVMISFNWNYGVKTCSSMTMPRRYGLPKLLWNSSGPSPDLNLTKHFWYELELHLCTRPSHATSVILLRLNWQKSLSHIPKSVEKSEGCYSSTFILMPIVRNEMINNHKGSW